MAAVSLLRYTLVQAVGRSSHTGWPPAVRECRVHSTADTPLAGRLYPARHW